MINLGNPGEYAIIDFARKIGRLVGSDPRIALLPLPTDDPRQRCPDIGKARRLLDWEPRIAVDEGLERTIGYFREKTGLK